MEIKTQGRKFIRQWMFEEINKGFEVKKTFPDYQVNEFEYAYPFYEGGGLPPHKLGIAVTTIYEDDLYFEYYSMDLELHPKEIDNKDDIISQMKTNIFRQMCAKNQEKLDEYVYKSFVGKNPFQNNPFIPNLE